MVHLLEVADIDRSNATDSDPGSKGNVVRNTNEEYNCREGKRQEEGKTTRPDSPRCQYCLSIHVRVRAPSRTIALPLWLCDSSGFTLPVHSSLVTRQPSLALAHRFCDLPLFPLGVSLSHHSPVQPASAIRPSIHPFAHLAPAPAHPFQSRVCPNLSPISPFNSLSPSNLQFGLYKAWLFLRPRLLSHRCNSVRASSSPTYLANSASFVDDLP
ncbi:hypothetical protein B0J13DRAFT_250170 [Dactylonectria estremocensis]|uniref:Uncharacterized protein n=1 Tax=Dactylonectria estremocensis TaxID=1079267 RepID=A0A9P9F2X6_9HYPO|nr:hypothetical protein B0J13DRAFT_250170 [Dactylonectria estremocensis]